MAKSSNSHRPPILGRPVSDPVILVFLAIVCLIGFVTHIGINGELIGWGPHYVNWASAYYPSQLVNGTDVHYEGIPNVRNAFFFGGGTAEVDLTYTIAQSRLFPPFIAAIVATFTKDVLWATYITSLLFWIGAAWAAYGIGRYDFNDEWMGIILGLMVALGFGYISKTFGTKTHVSGYAYYIITIFLSGRLGIFQRNTSFSNYVVMGLIVGLGAFNNGVHLASIVFILLLGIFRAKPLKLLSTVGIAVGLVGIVRVFYNSSISQGAIVRNIEDSIVSNLKIHIGAIYSKFVNGIDPNYTISSLSGSFDHTSIIGPYLWVTDIFPYILLVCGIPILTLAIVGIISPKKKELWISLVSIIAVLIPLIIILVYWPWNKFNGWLFYGASIGFFILAARGICNIADLYGGIARWLALPAPVVNGGMRVVVLGGVLVIFLFSNQDILFGRYIEHVRLDDNYFVSFPEDWGFRVLDW